MIPVKCKLIVLGNNDPSFNAEGGTRRRGLKQDFNNRFLEDEEYAEAKSRGETDIYLVKRGLKKKLNTTEYKLAFLLHSSRS